MAVTGLRTATDPLDVRFTTAWWPLAPFAGILLLALLARLTGLSAAWEIHIDELTYARLSQNVLHGEGVSLWGDPFHLHPPLFFGLEALYLWLFPAPADPVAGVLAVRPLNVLLAIATAAGVMLLVRRAAGPRAALAAGAIVALEPFLVKMNSRNMLETGAVTFLVLGYAVLTARGGRVRRRELAAGLLFGLAILTKDMTAAVVVLPLAAWWWMERRGLIALLTALATYAAYLLAVVAAGQWQDWIDAKGHGVLRAAGDVQTTGFKETDTGGHSLAGALVANAQELGATCLLLALGLPALWVLARSRSPVRRLVFLWGAVSYGLLGYLMAFGTFEEQMVYPLVVTVSVVAVVGAWSWVHRTRRRRARRLRAVEAALTGVLLVATVNWIQVQSTPDDGYRRLVAYVRANIPPDARIAVTTEPAKFILPGHDVAAAGSLSELRAARARYVVVSTYEATNDYGTLDAARLAEITGRSELVWSFRRARNGDLLAVYRLPEHF